MLQKEYPVSVDQVFLLLFTESEFIKKFETFRRHSDASIGEWTIIIDSESSNKVRELSYTVALNHAMAPKSSQVKERQTLLTGRDGRCYVVRCEVQNFGIPYADSFVVEKTYCLMARGPAACALQVHAGVKYVKSCWGLIKSKQTLF
jgi:hypothetical protein